MRVLNLGASLLLSKSNPLTVVGLVSVIAGFSLLLRGLIQVGKTRALVGNVVQLNGRVVKVDFRSASSAQSGMTNRYRRIEVILPDGATAFIDDDTLGFQGTSIGQIVQVLYDEDQNLLRLSMPDGDMRRRGLRTALTGFFLILIGLASFTAFVLLPELRRA